LDDQVDVLDVLTNWVALHFASNHVDAFASAGDFENCTWGTKCLAQFVRVYRDVDEFSACTVNNGWD
jgi:hypothetical protein